MLEIRTNGGISLDLPSDMQVDITLDNPFMYADKIPTPYSLSVELPASTTNKIALGNPNSATSKDVVESVTVELFFDGISFFSGTLVIDETQQYTISVTIEGVLLNGKYDTMVNEVKMKEYSFYDLGFNGQDSSKTKFANALNSSTQNKEPYVAAPIRDTSIKWDVVATQTVWMISRFLKTGRNLYNIPNQTFAFVDQNNNIDLPNITPIVKISHIFESLSMGVIDVNPFASKPFDQLVILPIRIPKLHESTYGLERVGSTNEYKLYLAKSLSSSAGDLLKELLKLLCASLRAVDNKFCLRYNKDIIADKLIIDWSNKIEDTYTITRVKGETYSWGLKISEKRGVDNVIDVTSVKAMLDAPNASNDDKNYRITTTGEVFKRTYKDTEPFFELLCAGKTDNNNKDSDYNATCALRAIECNVEKYIISKVDYFWNPYYIPIIDYSPSEEKDDMYIGIYHGCRPTIETGKNYPLVSSHNYDMMGNKLGDLSLFDIEGSLLSGYHTAFSEWLSRPKVKVTTRIKLNVNELKMLDIFQKVHCLGKDFYIKSITMHIGVTKIAPSDVELLEC